MWVAFGCGSYRYGATPRVGGWCGSQPERAASDTAGCAVRAVRAFRAGAGGVRSGTVALGVPEGGWRPLRLWCLACRDGWLPHRRVELVPVRLAAVPALCRAHRYGRTRTDGWCRSGRRGRTRTG
ncbi:hypothetical protein GCM10022285_42970 [Streptomyces tunisiensis]|uniref:Uncharacterized protein n=1 Tax=Streptomyces tunisiensis TaxID=948699 RepID=A0ABP7YVQ1_9ACTN